MPRRPRQDSGSSTTAVAAPHAAESPPQCPFRDVDDTPFDWAVIYFVLLYYSPLAAGGRRLAAAVAAVVVVAAAVAAAH